MMQAKKPIIKHKAAQQVVNNMKAVKKYQKTDKGKENSATAQAKYKKTENGKANGAAVQAKY
jgi:hypothetical protein